MIVTVMVVMVVVMMMIKTKHCAGEQALLHWEPWLQASGDRRAKLKLLQQSDPINYIPSQSQ